jgi:hypothetical protein
MGSVCPAPREREGGVRGGSIEEEPGPQATKQSMEDGPEVGQAKVVVTLP